MNKWEQYKAAPTLELRNELLLENEPLARKVTGALKRTLAAEVEYDDLYSYAIFGLYDAIEKFDPTAGNQFQTYAYRRIHGAVIDELRKEDWIPRLIRSYNKKVANYLAEYEAMGIPISEEELAEALGVTVEKHRSYLAGVPVMASLDFSPPEEESDEATANEFLEIYISVDLDKRNALVDAICSSLAKMDNKELIVFWLYYYIDLEYDKIAETIDISEPRARQIHKKCCFQLQQDITKCQL